MNSKKSLILAGVIFLLVGIIFAIAGIIVMQQDNSLKKRCTEQAIGTVVEVICERDSNTTSDDITYTYFPVIEYQVGDRTISQRSRSGQTPPKYQVGDQVEIYYNPNDVEEFIIKGDLTPKYFGIGFTVIGAIVAVIGVIILIRNAGKSERSEEYISTNIES